VNKPAKSRLLARVVQPAGKDGLYWRAANYVRGRSMALFVVRKKCGV